MQDDCSFCRCLLNADAGISDESQAGAVTPELQKAVTRSEPARRSARRLRSA
jgi:hypothetical protein